MKRDTGKIFELYLESYQPNTQTLASRVQETLDWLLPIDDFEEAEDSCNMELDYVGEGRESIVYLDNGVIIKINASHEREIWERFSNLDCFVKTEIFETNFGLVILQEELTIDASAYWESGAQTQIENCIQEAGLKYSRNEVTDENVGMTDDGEWKLFDIPIA